MTIVFRADASTQIGTGHVMRCLTLANALQERKAHCHFICRVHVGHLIDLIKSQGFTVTVLPFAAVFESIHKPTDLAHARWLGSTQEEDAGLTIAALSEVGQPVDWLVVDHYGIDATWESLVVPHAKRIFVIDDLADRRHACDVLLDQNLGKTKSDYANLVGENCVTLLGPKYALLQRQYSELQPNRSLRGSVQNILIYFGGSDQHDLTGMAAKACLQLGRPDIQLNVVIGSSYAYKPALEQLANQHPNLHLHQNLPSLALLMFEADLAIGAGGSTSWERCAMGLPTMIVTIADNQVPTAHELHKAQVAEYIGKAEEITQVSFEQTLKKWLSRSDLADWSKRCVAITDGGGVERVVETMGVTKKGNLELLCK